MNRSSIYLCRHSGMSLPIVLILLIPLTLLGVTLANRNNLEELMAAGQRDSQQALMNAESGLALTQQILEQVDAGTFSSTLDQILADPDGDIGINGYTVTDYSGSSKGIVTVKVVDNYEPEEDIDPGFQNPFGDTDGRVLVRSTGIYRGGERVVEAVYYLQRTAGAGSANASPMVIFAEDDLSISGNPFIWGPNANVHSNSNMDISGNPEIWGNVSAHGEVNVSGNPVNQDGDALEYTENANAIATPYVYPPAYKPYASFYLTNDCDVYDGWPDHPDPAQRGSLVKNDVKDNGPWNGWNCDYNKEWKMDTGDWIEGFFYVEANVIISANPGEGEPAPAKMSIVAEGYIEVSGNPNIEPYYVTEFDPDDAVVQSLIDGRENVLLSNKILFYAGNDLKINGNADQHFSGIMAAHMEFAISGAPNLAGCCDR